MARNVTDAFIAACNATESDEAFIILVTVEYETPGVTESLYLCNNGETVTSRGIDFLALPMQITLSDDSDDRPPVAKLVLDNIDRRLIEIIREIEIPPTITLEVVRTSAPDTVELHLSDFTLKSVDYNLLTIEGTLTLEGLFSEQAIGFSFTPSYFPGLYALFLMIGVGVNYVL